MPQFEAILRTVLTNLMEVLRDNIEEQSPHVVTKNWQISFIFFAMSLPISSGLTSEQFMVAVVRRLAFQTNARSTAPARAGALIGKPRLMVANQCDFIFCFLAHRQTIRLSTYRVNQFF
jgi:hypothetical protein